MVNRLKIHIFYAFPDWFWATRVGFWLYKNDYVIDGEPEDCWCGSFELGEED